MNDNDPLTQLIAIKKNYVDATLAWYKARTTWPRITFRVVGVLVIGLSLALPVLATSYAPAVPYAALAVAMLSAFNSFFSWQRVWEKRITIQLALEGLTARWETAMLAAQAESDPSVGFQHALTATQELIEKTSALSATETAAFFTSIRFPQSLRDGDAKAADNEPRK